MRIGIENIFKNSDHYVRIWQILLSSINETVEWVPQTDWTALNLTSFDAVRTDVLDSTVTPWLVTDVRVDLVNFTLPLSMAELVLKVSDGQRPSVLSRMMLPDSILSVLSPGWVVGHPLARIKCDIKLFMFYK